MNLPNPHAFGDYLVFVDESGDHGLARVDPGYPIFVLAFRRICDGANALNRRLPLELVMIPKASNSTGLQITDLVARSVGIKVLRPMQPNLAYDIVAKKFRRSPTGETRGWGLKVFP